MFYNNFLALPVEVGIVWWLEWSSLRSYKGYLNTGFQVNIYNSCLCSRLYFFKKLAKYEQKSWILCHVISEHIHHVPSQDDQKKKITDQCYFASTKFRPKLGLDLKLVLAKKRKTWEPSAVLFFLNLILFFIGQLPNVCAPSFYVELFDIFVCHCKFPTSNKYYR